MKDKVLGWLLPLFLVIAFALIFSSIFVGKIPVAFGESLINSAIATVSRIVFLFAAALLAHRIRLSIRSLYFALLVVTFLKLFVSAIEDQHSILMIISMILAGGIVGLGLTVAVASFTLFPLDRARKYLLLGVAGAFLIRAALVFSIPQNEDLVFKICLYVFMLFITLFVLLNPKTAKTYPAVKSVSQKSQAQDETPEKKGRLASRLASYNTSVLTVFLGMLLMVFSFGAFEVYSLSQGLTLLDLNMAMYAAFFIVLFMCVIAYISKFRQFFDEIHHMIWMVFILLYLIVLAFSTYTPALFTVLSVGFIVLNISLLIDLVEASITDGISPIFRFGVFYGALVVVHVGGFCFSLIQILLLGTEDYFVSKLVTISLSAIAFILTLTFMILVRRKDKKAETPLPEQDGTAHYASLEQFFTHYGLSDREREVVELYSQGRTAAYISSKLFLSESTVRAYTRQAYTKFGVHSKQEMLTLFENQNF